MIWDSVTEKIERRLASLERIYLSKRETISLIKSMLSNILNKFSLFFLCLQWWSIEFRGSFGVFCGGVKGRKESFT